MEWARLENASKIFPATWTIKDPKVFRLACELYEDIVPEFLQRALDKTMDDFPLYKSVLRRGLFWYYLEKSDIRAEVRLESTTVCAPIYVGLRNHLLFRVSYYRKRINLEVFHALSDGAGAVQFLQALLYHYIALKDNDKRVDTVSGSENSPISRQMDDSFGKHFTGDNKKKRRDRKQEKAYRIPGTRLSDNRMNLIEGVMSAREVLEQAHKHNATLTVFLTSLFMSAISKEMRARSKKYPVVLSIPVNLRQYYESETTRNFFSTINIGFHFDNGADDLTSVMAQVSQSFKSELTVEQLDYQLNKFMSIERNFLARIVPLPLKDLVVRIAVQKAMQATTSTLSNVGVIKMPAEFQQIIRQFSVCTSAARPQMTICSFGDRLVVSIASPYRETDIQRIFFQMLSTLGIDVEISSSI